MLLTIRQKVPKQQPFVKFLIECEIRAVFFIEDFFEREDLTRGLADIIDPKG